MNEEKKGFNLNVLISLLVGVISLIVIIPTVTMIMNKNRPEEIKPEEYRLIVNIDYNFTFNFNGETIESVDILNRDLMYLDNLISLSKIQDNVVMTIFYPDEDEEDSPYFKSLAIRDNDASYYGEYMFTYLDPVSNEKLYGTYDFSNIILTEENQVLNPIYTPF